MELDQRFGPDETGVIAKVIDGEAIIIRHADGMYFSMNPAGSFVWELIEHRRTVSDIVAGLTARFGVVGDEVRADVVELLEELLREKLVVTIEGSASAEGPARPPDEGGQPYEPPRLHRYQDMADLLALDPPAPGLARAAWRDPIGDD